MRVYTFLVCVCANVYGMYMYVYTHMSMYPSPLWMWWGGGGTGPRKKYIHIYIYIIYLFMYLYTYIYIHIHCLHKCRQYGVYLPLTPDGHAHFSTSQKPCEHCQKPSYTLWEALCRMTGSRKQNLGFARWGAAYATFANYCTMNKLRLKQYHASWRKQFLCVLRQSYQRKLCLRSDGWWRFGMAPAIFRSCSWTVWCSTLW